MYLFCGDSHSRQFRTEKPGLFTHCIFSGATIKGLTNSEADKRHGEMTRYFARAPVRKSLFLMFGSVDLDFSFYRKAALEGPFDQDAWIDQRIAVYNVFLGQLLRETNPPGGFRAIRVLAPQASPLDDERFLPITAVHARVTVEQLESVAAHTDLGHVARNQRILHFNDRLEEGLLKHRLIKMCRIDREMIDEEGHFRDNFRPRRHRDHHANIQESLLAWAHQLGGDVPAFAKLIRPKLTISN